ncbi:hypothetical protein FLAG1_07521 [Fusarium langsethiae]|uniref:Uncharacterized protein n=1 Tax=Fusarium langsethiae TaxID=179993 RepID=A0A0M9ETR9_FUSLA|nr:hypothetical protein FLAG1_07521 [Fusarium langsethiae]GKU07300.1 unnamed protein product [Fusarium langsethiae]GKU23093.1 unnamed protein product [Fusarium langsethiae]
MENLKIHTVISSDYLVFDKSGKLPFSISFGLCRLLDGDTDPRNLGLKTTRSILDIPYALSHGLLSLQEDGKEVDVGQLKPTDPSIIDTPFQHLNSPVSRNDNIKKDWSVYHYHVHTDSELAALFKSGKKYTIRNKSGDLGEYMFINENGQLSKPDEAEKLCSSRANGRALFDVVEFLPWPPEMETAMKRCNGTEDDTLRLEITVAIKGNEAISVQTRGRQRFLSPSGPIEPEPGFPTQDARPRIIDPEKPTPAATIQIFHAATNKAVRGTTQPGVCGLYQKHDTRPKLETLTTLKPGEPVIRHVDVDDLVAKLPDGKFSLRMERRGMWWCVGDCEEFAAAGEDRVPSHLYNTKIPPVMLECGDVVEIEVKDGVAR